MKRVLSAGLFVLFCVSAAQAQQYVRFNYTQTDATTGSGQLQPFTYDPGDGGGPITFGATPMPAATVINPGTGTFVGRQTVAGGNSNEGNVVPGIVWTGFVTATGTRGSEIHTIQIPLKFAPKITQSPDISDYEWNVIFGDDAAGGADVVTTAAPRFAMWYSRDDVVSPPAVETPNTFQRYTQQNNAFSAGQNNFTNTHLTTTAIKDAIDGGDPQGTDAAGRDLAFYFGWRDQGTFAAGSPQVFMVDNITVGGLLAVPEPASLLGLAGMATLALFRRRRA
jgi:hypothetical protein